MNNDNLLGFYITTYYKFGISNFFDSELYDKIIACEFNKPVAMRFSFKYCIALAESEKMNSIFRLHYGLKDK